MNAGGITLPKTAKLKVGATSKPAVSVTPADADDAEAILAAVTWKSSDEAIATVAADGTITAVAAGTATITATSGAFVAEITVTVTAE